MHKFVGVLDKYDFFVSGMEDAEVTKSLFIP